MMFLQGMEVVFKVSNVNVQNDKAFLIHLRLHSFGAILAIPIPV